MQMTNYTNLKVRMTEKALRRGFTTGRHAPVEGITCAVAVHNRGDAETALEEMVKKHEAGWAQYGATGTYHIVDTEAAKEFIEDNGGDLPFGFDS